MSNAVVYCEICLVTTLARSQSLVVTLKSITHISAEHIPELSFAVERLLDGCCSGERAKDMRLERS